MDTQSLINLLDYKIKQCKQSSYETRLCIAEQHITNPAHHLAKDLSHYESKIEAFEEIKRLLL